VRALISAGIVLSCACAAAPIVPVAQPTLQWSPADGLLICGETRIRIPDFLRPSVKQTKPDEVELVLPARGLGALVVKVRGRTASQSDRSVEWEHLKRLAVPDWGLADVGSLRRDGHIPIELAVARANVNDLEADKRFGAAFEVARGSSTSCHLSAIEQLLPDSDTGPGLLALIESVVETSEQDGRERGLVSDQDKKAFREGYRTAEAFLQIAGFFLWLLKP